MTQGAYRLMVFRSLFALVDPGVCAMFNYPIVKNALYRTNKCSKGREIASGVIVHFFKVIDPIRIAK